MRLGRASKRPCNQLRACWLRILPDLRVVGAPGTKTENPEASASRGERRPRAQPPPGLRRPNSGSGAWESGLGPGGPEHSPEGRVAGSSGNFPFLCFHRGEVGLGWKRERGRSHLNACTQAPPATLGWVWTFALKPCLLFCCESSP